MSLPFSEDYWNNKISGYAKEDWSAHPSPFAQLVAGYLQSSSKILELGAGMAQDGLWFAGMGHRVIISDATDKSFSEIQKRAGNENISLVKVNLLKKLPFDDHSLDAVYAHLVLHYFDNATMNAIVAEIQRVLKPDGILACMVNTKTDEEYSPEQADESDIIMYRGIAKRFFTTNSLKQFMNGFETVILNDKGRTPKDEAAGNSGMIQFIGKKHV